MVKHNSYYYLNRKLRTKCFSIHYNLLAASTINLTLLKLLKSSKDKKSNNLFIITEPAEIVKLQAHPKTSIYLSFLKLTFQVVGIDKIFSVDRKRCTVGGRQVANAEVSEFIH